MCPCVCVYTYIFEGWRTKAALTVLAQCDSINIIIISCLFSVFQTYNVLVLFHSNKGTQLLKSRGRIYRHQGGVG